ncbi:MAG: PilZ domain-containing protein [Pseudomonadota bacterium]
MFWKKKKNKPPADEDFNLEYEEGPRYYFRVSTSPQHPVLFQSGEHFYQVEDVSAGGLALRGPGLLSGQRLAGVLRLPGDDLPLPLIMVLRNISPDGLAGGQIAKIKEQDRERIHMYVLARQKEELEERRRIEDFKPDDTTQV